MNEGKDWYENTKTGEYSLIRPISIACESCVELIRSGSEQPKKRTKNSSSSAGSVWGKKYYDRRDIRSHLPGIPESSSNLPASQDNLKIFSPTMPPPPVATPDWDQRYTLDELTVDITKIKLGKKNSGTFQFVKRGGQGLE